MRAKCIGELGVVMDFREKSLTIAGEKRPTQMLNPGHPALDVAEYDDDGNFDQEFFVAAETAEGQTPGGVAKRGVRKRLTRVVEALIANNEKPRGPLRPPNFGHGNNKCWRKPTATAGGAKVPRFRWKLALV